MAYEVKYRLDYCNKEKLNARLDFEIKDYTSTIIHDIVGTQNAFSYKVRNEKPDRSGYFRTLEADINIFEDENFNIDNLLTSDETAIRVKFYIEGQLEFVGFIIPDFFEVSIDKPRVISMVASDRIGTLKNQTLPRQTGVQSYRYMLEQSLLKTGLDLTINSTINFNPVGETGDFLTKTGGLMERLSSDKGASISCYDIIKSILIVSNAFLLQENGQWHILNKLEYESRPKTKDIEKINVGGRRMINPPSSKVGVMAEFGGTPNYPKNHNFKTLEGWAARYGFNVEINDKQVEEIVGSNVTYGDNSVNNSAKCFGNTHMWNVSDETLNPALESSRARVFSLNTQLIDAKLSINATVAHNSVGTNVDYIYFRYTIFAESTSETLYYDGNSFRKYGSKPKESGWITAEKLDGNGAQEINQSVNFSLVFDDIDNPKNVNDYSFYVRIYGAGTDNTVFLNLVKIEFQDKEEHPKGNLYKIEQGVNFTKESEIDTTVFGGYINKGVNGYFYNYQRDELNQIYYKIGSRWESFGLKWQTANNNTADYLLLHSVRQRAVMFSAPHDIITATVSGKFSPLDIYDVCGSKFVLVEAEYNFYRNETELRIEEIKYDNSVLKTDFIYSYFGGEDTTSISGVSGVSSGGSVGGGGAPCLIKIDEDGNYYVEENFYSLKDVSAFGKDNLGGGGGEGGALTSWVDQITTLTDFNEGTNFIKQSEVVDNLTSNLSNLPLSARQGMILKNFIDNIEVGEGGQVVVDWDSILGKPSTFAPSAHTHVISDVTDLQNALDAKTSKSYVDDGLATKENVFDKNTAFNRNFGTTAGTVASGNHTHKFSEITDTPTTLSGYGITDGAKSVDVDAHITDKENPHEVDKYQIELGNVINVKQATKTEFDTFKNLFDSLFELDGDYIKAKKSLYSTGDLSAFGKDNLGGGGGTGGTDLVSWVDQIMTLTDFNQGSNFIKISDVEAKGYATVTQLNDRVKTPVPLNAKFTDTIVDISGKVDKVAGKSLIPDSEIARLANVTNQDLTPYATNSRVNAIDTRLVTVESNYTTQSDIDTAIDGIEVGGRNYFVKKTQSVGYINHNDGNLGVATSHISSDFIEASPSEKYIFSPKSGNLYYPRIVFYNATKTFISGLILNGATKDWQIETPLNTVFVRVSSDTAQSTKEFQFEKGNEKTDWTPAPEDQVSDWNETDVTSFSYIKNKPTQLSQFSDNIGVGSHIENKANPHAVTTSQIGAVNLTTNQTIGGEKSFNNYLQINGSTVIDGNSLNIFLSGNRGKIMYGENTVADRKVAFGSGWGTIDDFAVFTKTSGSFSAETQRFTVKMGGNVGIGTTSPQSKLDVNGEIKANGLKLTGWTLAQIGTELQFKYNGTIKARMTADGHIIANGDVTAFG